MASYGVSVDLTEVLSAHYSLVQQLYPMLSQAVEFTASDGAYRWKDKVFKSRLWEGEKNAYVESIQWKMNSPFEAVIWTDYDKAAEIEGGRPARDLKRMLQTSKKTRMVKQGERAGMRYLIIPFRHNIPTPSGEGALAPQMPPHVYAKAKPLKASSVLPPGTKKPGTRLSASGHLVPQNSYSWGERLPHGLVPKLKDHHSTDIYAGMVRFNTTPDGGRAKRSSYLTFRIMGEWSSGWIIEAKPGLELAKKVADELQPVLETNIGQAITLGMLKR